MQLLQNVNNCVKYFFLQQFIAVESDTFETGHVSLIEIIYDLNKL